MGSVLGVLAHPACDYSRQGPCPYASFSSRRAKQRSSQTATQTNKPTNTNLATRKRTPAAIPMNGRRNTSRTLHSRKAITPVAATPRMGFRMARLRERRPPYGNSSSKVSAPTGTRAGLIGFARFGAGGPATRVWGSDPVARAGHCLALVPAREAGVRRYSAGEQVERRPWLPVSNQSAAAGQSSGVDRSSCRLTPCASAAGACGAAARPKAEYTSRGCAAHTPRSAASAG